MFPNSLIFFLQSSQLSVSIPYMEKQIEYFVKNVYGNELSYIKDRELARIIKRLTQK